MRGRALMQRICLRRDERGAALVEFALVAPVLCLALLGLFELGYNLYLQAQLQGSVQQAARASAIEGGAARADLLDETVTRAVRRIAPRATAQFQRTSYTSFSDVGVAEDFNDANHDGICNDSEQFEDANGNGAWDRDRGRAGSGGARDVVLYSVTITYPRPFGLSRLLGWSPTARYEAITVLRNQPWDEQQMVATVGICP